MGEYDDLPLVDCHVHMRGMASLQNLAEVLEVCELDAMSVLSLLRDDEHLKANVLGLLFKAQNPGRVYAFGGLRHPESGNILDPRPYQEQARRLMEIGCDGIKMIEGKPTSRKALDRPLDSREYDPLYVYLREQRVPLLFHVADPETFWDPELAPPSAHERGWYYGDGTFPEKEELYSEVDRVLEKHPDLSVVFAHFYFLSADLDRLEAFLGEHPTVNVDITPGSEMYANFSRQPERAREFFVDHADRIFFGTDNSGGRTRDPEKARVGREKIENMRRFLETDDAFEWWGMDIQGIALPREALSAIYADNFRRWAGEEPKPVDLTESMAECGRLAELAEQAGQEGVAEEMGQIAADLRRAR